MRHGGLLLVKFSCQILKQTRKHLFGWVALTCWRQDQVQSLSVDVKIGMRYITGQVSDIQKDHGVLITKDVVGIQYSVYFLASRFYNDGEGLSVSQTLRDVLSPGDNVFFDAVPCIREENEYGCKWYATCVFKGKRPTATNIISDPPTGDANTDRVLRIIANCSNDPRVMFVIGNGILMNTLNDDFGLILGEFRYNVFKEVLFHKRNAFLFKMSLDDCSLPEILKKGDRMKFVAVGAPPGFFVEWIAIQVSVCDVGEYDIPKYNGFQRYVNDMLLGRNAS